MKAKSNSKMTLDKPYGASLSYILSGSCINRFKERQDKIKDFDSVDELLGYLANAKLKEREAFLKSWKNSNAAQGLGRPKTSREEKKEWVAQFDDWKSAAEKKLGKNLSVRAYLEYLYEVNEKISSEVTIDEWRKSYKALEAKLSRRRIELKKNLSQ